MPSATTLLVASAAVGAVTVCAEILAQGGRQPRRAAVVAAWVTAVGTAVGIATGAAGGLVETLQLAWTLAAAFCGGYVVGLVAWVAYVALAIASCGAILVGYALGVRFRKLMGRLAARLSSP